MLPKPLKLAIVSKTKMYPLLSAIQVAVAVAVAVPFHFACLESDALRSGVFRLIPPPTVASPISNTALSGVEIYRGVRHRFFILNHTSYCSITKGFVPTVHQ